MDETRLIKSVAFVGLLLLLSARASLAQIGPTEDCGQKGEKGAPGGIQEECQIGNQGFRGEIGPRGERGPLGPVGPRGKDCVISVPGYSDSEEELSRLEREIERQVSNRINDSEVDLQLDDYNLKATLTTKLKEEVEQVFRDLFGQYVGYGDDGEFFSRFEGGNNWLTKGEKEGEYDIKSDKCSMTCGEGSRTVRKIECSVSEPIKSGTSSEGNNMTCSFEGVRIEKCQAPIWTCPQDKTYGPWTGWSPCSKTCIDNLEDIPFQRRSRTCEPNCAVGFIEDRPCLVPVCPPVCPDYEASDFSKDLINPRRANITFSLQVGKVPFGRLIRQEISFLPIDQADNDDNDPILKWNIDNNPQPFIKWLHGNKASLRMDHSYLPKIRMISEVTLPWSADHKYRRVSSVVQICEGTVLHCNQWICKDKKKRIMWNQVCNGKTECNDGSDEDKLLCTGNPQAWIFAVGGCLLLYCIFSCLLYASVHGVFKRKERPEGKNMDTEVELDEKGGLAQTTLLELKRLLQKESKLSKDDLTSLQRVMAEEVRNKNMTQFIYVLRYMANGREEEECRNQIVDAVLSTEISSQNGNVSEAITQLRNLCSGDDKLAGWFFSIVERGMVHKVKHALYIQLKHLRELAGTKISACALADGPTRVVIPEMMVMLFYFIPALRKLFFFFLDVYKDLALFFIFSHLSDELFENNFYAVGDLNLDRLRYALVISAILSHLVIIFRSWHHHHPQSKEPMEKLKQVGCFIFPFPFALLDKTRLKYIESRLEAKIECTLWQEDSQKSVSQLKNKTSELQSTRRELNFTHVHYTDLQLLESIVERLPQAVAFWSLYRASLKYPRLHHIITEIFTEQIGISLTWTFYLGFGTGLVGLLNSVLNHRTAHRCPMTLTLTGKALYMLAVVSLALPKLYLTVVCLEQAPYFYIFTAVAEMVIFLIVLSIIYGGNIISRVFNLTTWSCLVAPCFLPQQELCHSSQWRTFLNSGRNMPFTLIVSALTALVVYLPAGIILQHLTVLPRDTFWDEMIEAQAYVGLGMGCHVIFALLYYFLGHRWKMAIKEGRQKKGLTVKLDA